MKEKYKKYGLKNDENIRRNILWENMNKYAEKYEEMRIEYEGNTQEIWKGKKKDVGFRKFPWSPLYMSRKT